MVRGIIFFLFAIIPGAAASMVSGYFALVDWAQLQADYSRYQSVVNHGADLRAVFVAYGAQEIHRTNLFADGVWALLGLILFGLGLLGIFGNSSRR